MRTTAAILISLAGPALAAEEPCFITKRVPVDWSRAQPPPPVDGSPVRPSDTPELQARYARWLAGWRARQSRQEDVRKVEVPCQAEARLARPQWQEPGFPFPPAGVVFVPHPDYEPGPRTHDQDPPQAVPAPGAIALFAGVGLFLLARQKGMSRGGGSSGSPGRKFAQANSP